MNHDNGHDLKAQLSSRKHAQLDRFEPQGVMNGDTRLQTPQRNHTLRSWVVLLYNNNRTTFVEGERIKRSVAGSGRRRRGLLRVEHYKQVALLG